MDNTDSQNRNVLIIRGKKFPRITSPKKPHTVVAAWTANIHITKTAKLFNVVRRAGNPGNTQGLPNTDTARASEMLMLSSRDRQPH